MRGQLDAKFAAQQFFSSAVLPIGTLTLVSYALTCTYECTLYHPITLYGEKLMELLASTLLYLCFGTEKPFRQNRVTSTIRPKGRETHFVYGLYQAKSTHENNKLKVESERGG